MNDSEKDSDTSKRPSFITEPSGAHAGPPPESNRVLASLGGTSMAKPERRRYGPGIWTGAVLMFAAGSVSTLMYRNGSSNETPVCEPPLQMAAASPSAQSTEILPAPSALAASTETPSDTEVQSEAARILNTDHTTAPADAADAAPHAGHVTPVITSKPAAAAASSSKGGTSATSAKTRQAKAKSNRTVSKRNDRKTAVANADPDVDVIEALLRYGSTSVDRSADVPNKAKVRGTGS